MYLHALTCGYMHSLLYVLVRDTLSRSQYYFALVCLTDALFIHPPYSPHPLIRIIFFIPSSLLTLPISSPPHPLISFSSLVLSADAIQFTVDQTALAKTKKADVDAKADKIYVISVVVVAVHPSYPTQTSSHHILILLPPPFLTSLPPSPISP